MAIQLVSQRALRPIQSLPFCYLCARSFEPGEDCDVDHVPPSGLFLPADRDFPLILPTHKTCNNSRSQDDQAVSQLVGLLHGRPPEPDHNKLQFLVGSFASGGQALAVTGIDLRVIIRRWLRAFHAALYAEPLPEGRLFITGTPLPEGNLVPSGVEPVPVPDVTVEFVKELKRNRATTTIDRIVCRNSKCRYECVWSQADNGTWLCIYGLDIYGWIALGDTRSFEPRGCVGAYHRPDKGVPSAATRGTRLEFSFESQARLDPFGT